MTNTQATPEQLDRGATPMTDNNAIAQELEACPLCHSRAELTLNEMTGENTMAECVSCGCRAFYKKWNTRTPAPASGDVETGWLIELPWTVRGGGRLCWVALEPGRFPLFKTLNHNDDYDFQKIESPLKFTPESNEALRFSRKIDAENFMAKFDLYLLHAIATEHQWTNATADMLERLAGPEWARITTIKEASDHLKKLKKVSATKP